MAAVYVYCHQQETIHPFSVLFKFLILVLNNYYSLTEILISETLEPYPTCCFSYYKLCVYTLDAVLCKHLRL